MNVQQMGCCAFNEIGELRDSATPKDAMLLFCERVFPPFAPRLRPGAFYIFTAVVKSRAMRDREVGDYGDKFYNFIKRNRLGIVLQTRVQPNRRNVPGHYIRGWIWTPPNEKNLRKWWKKNKRYRGY